METLNLPLCILVLCVIVFGRGENVTCPPETLCFTRPQVLKSPGYPRPYPGNLSRTWLWQREEGRWGVYFSSYNVTTIGCKDYLNISDTKRSLIYCSDTRHPPFYSTTPKLKIHFVSGNTSTPGNFKLTILYGKDYDDLRKQIFYEKHGRRSKALGHNMVFQHHRNIVVAVGCVIGAVVLVLAIACFLVYRKRVLERKRDQMTTLGIRRGSGVRYARKASSNSDPPAQGGHAPSGTTPPEPTVTIVMGNGTRPWTVRAVMMNPHSSAAYGEGPTAPKSAHPETNHGSHGHTSTRTYSTTQGHAHNYANAHAHSRPHGHTHAPASGAARPMDGAAMRASSTSRGKEESKSHEYTPLPTSDSRCSGVWQDETRPILEE